MSRWPVAQRTRRSARSFASDPDATQNTASSPSGASAATRSDARDDQVVVEARVGVQQAQLARHQLLDVRVRVPEHGDVVDHVEVHAAVGVVQVVAPAALDLGRLLEVVLLHARDRRGAAARPARPGRDAGRRRVAAEQRRRVGAEGAASPRRATGVASPGASRAGSASAWTWRCAGSGSVGRGLGDGADGGARASRSGRAWTDGHDAGQPDADAVAVEHHVAGRRRGPPSPRPAPTPACPRGDEHVGAEVHGRRWIRLLGPGVHEAALAPSARCRPVAAASTPAARGRIGPGAEPQHVAAHRQVEHAGGHGRDERPGRRADLGQPAGGRAGAPGRAQAERRRAAPRGRPPARRSPAASATIQPPPRNSCAYGVIGLEDRLLLLADRAHRRARASISGQTASISSSDSGSTSWNPRVTSIATSSARVGSPSTSDCTAVAMSEMRHVSIRSPKSISPVGTIRPARSRVAMTL